MAHLWVEDRSTTFNGGHSTDGIWVAIPLGDRGAFALHAGGARPVRAWRDTDECSGAALLLRSRGPEGDTWLVMNATQIGVRLNGVPLLTGIHSLSDRDELHLDGLGRVFFSTEHLACIESFPGAERSLFCPRCKQEIDKHCPAVRCPQCNVWHHQSVDLPCWTYSGACALCDQPTPLGAGYRWTPEEL